MRLGRFDVEVVSDGTFRLDAGTMFGVVPKVLWERLVEVDDRNRAEYALNALLVRTPEHCVLIDTGLGRNLDEKEREIYAVSGDRDLLASLSGLGVHATDVDLLIPSHLHLDHAGWCTCIRDGSVRPTFPHARCIVQARELEHARNPCELTRGSYVPEHFEPLADAGLLTAADGDTEIVPGVRVVRTGGHTAGHQAVFIESDGNVCVFVGDLIPTTAHLRLAYGMAYDNFPLDVVAQKKRLLVAAEENGWILAFPHEVQTPLARVATNSKGRCVAVPVGAGRDRAASDEEPPGIPSLVRSGLGSGSEPRTRVSGFAPDQGRARE